MLVSQTHTEMPIEVSAARHIREMLVSPRNSNLINLRDEYENGESGQYISCMKAVNRICALDSQAGT